MNRHALSICLILLAPSISAQATWSHSIDGSSLGLRISKGVYSEGAPGFATFALIPELTLLVAPRMAVEAELPIARASQRVGFTGSREVSGMVIGNPYVGLSMPIVGSDVMLRIGLRGGLGESNPDAGSNWARLHGMLSEFDRFESFAIDMHTVRSDLQLGRVPASGSFLQGRIGAAVFFGDDGGGTRSIASYGLRFGDVSRRALIHAGVVGRTWVDRGAGSFGDRSSHQLVAGVGGTRGRVRPEFEARYFLDAGTSDVLRLVLAATLRMELGQ